MAMSMGGGKGAIKADINVTPLVDIMLVLLIIMMLIAPLLQKGVELTLPTAFHRTDKPDTADQTVVYIDRNNKLYVNAIEVPAADVAARLGNVFETKTDRTVYLKGDAEASYSAIMAMMDALRKAGIDNVSLIADTPAGQKAGGGQ